MGSELMDQRIPEAGSHFSYCLNSFFYQWLGQARLCVFTVPTFPKFFFPPFCFFVELHLNHLVLDERWLRHTVDPSTPARLSDRLSPAMTFGTYI